MPENAQHDRDWEHWPVRGESDGIRHRLRSLFAPTGDEDVVEEIAERDRELARRTVELQTTVADLERREERTRRLREAVEQMLRHGVAEMDDRQGQLNALAVELAEREEELTRASDELTERRQELGAVELHRAALERRERGLEEREQRLEQVAGDLVAREQRLAGLEKQARELEDRAARITADEQRLASGVEELEQRQRRLATLEASLRERELRVTGVEERARSLEQLKTALAERERELAAERAEVEQVRAELARAVGAASAGLGMAQVEPVTAEGWVALVPGDRYLLRDGEGTAPLAGAVVEVDERLFRVVGTGPSPLPGDRRRCVFLEPAAAPDEPT